MDKAKPLPDAPDKKKEKTAPIEFVAPYSLHDCVYRIRDTKSLDTGFMSPGIDPSYEKIEPGVYHFKIRRTWYDTRYRRHYSMVELNGYLKGLDETSTAVIAETHTSRMTVLLLILIVGLMILSGTLTPQKSGSIIFIIGGGLILLLYIGMIAWDRRTLKNVIHRAMSDEF